MRILISVFVVSLAVGFTYGQTVKVERYARTTKASTRLQLRAEVESATAQAGSVVRVKLTLKNIYSKPVRLDDGAPDFDYGIKIADTFGKEPPRTQWGEKKFRGEAFSLRQATLDLAPGEEVHVTIELTKEYQLTQPGQYYVRVTRGRVWTETDEDSKRFYEIVFSNPAQFTIVP